MTRAEAIKWLEEAVNDTNNDFDLCSEALKKSCCFKRMYLKWPFLRLLIRMANGSAWRIGCLRQAPYWQQTERL